MKALWWFKDGAIAGMARPGFNAVHCTDLPFEEAILFGWLGQYSSGSIPLESFRHHLQTYAPKTYPFFNLSRESGEKSLEIFKDPSGFTSVAHRLAERIKAFADIRADDTHVHFKMNYERIQWEADSLKNLGVRRIVALTESHHNTDKLAHHFDLHHLSIVDLGAPSDEQVHALAEILKTSREKKEIVAVHCLAGIGRTSTMLIGAHLAMGLPLEDILANLSERNPCFQLLGSQAEFVHSFRKRLITV